MLADAFEAEVEDDVRLLLKKIADLNAAAKSRGGKITARQYADLNHMYTEVVTRAETHTKNLDVAMERVGGSLEIALASVMNMATRIEA